VLSLVETLNSIRCAQLQTDIASEVLIVDNGSEDATRSVVAGIEQPPLHARYVFEPRKGKGYAYNRGIAEANGRILLFTDDDVRVPPNWIEAMCSPILMGKADATQGGIDIAPSLQPDWLTAAHRVHLTEIGDLSEQHARQPFLIGASMAFTREAYGETGGFDPALGPGGLGFMDETLFYLQLLRGGKKIVFVRGAAVEHHFDSRRLTREDQLRSARAHGRSGAWVMHHWSHESVPWRRLKMVRNLARLMLADIKWRMSPKIGFDPDEVTYAQRYWTYRELGKLHGVSRLYERHALRRRDASGAEAIPQPQFAMASSEVC